MKTYKMHKKGMKKKGNFGMYKTKVNPWHKN